jgi:hypothetical protein
VFLIDRRRGAIICLDLLVAARDPGARRFFLYFTAWANLAQGALMVGVAA